MILNHLAQLLFSAPIALMSHSVGSGKTVTSHPSVKEQLDKGKHSPLLLSLYRPLINEPWHEISNNLTF